MAIIILLFMNLTVIFSSFFLTYKLFRVTGFFDSLIAWFILYFAQIIFTELLLGILGALYLTNIIFLNLVIFLVIWLPIHKKGTSFSLSGLRDALLLILYDKAALFIISILLAFTLVKIFFNLLNPPLGWDCLNYHFTFPVEWMKSGTLDNPIVVSDDPFPTYYPINGSLLFFWFMLPFRSAFLADLAQLPFFIISFLAVFSMARRLELKREYAFFAASLFVMIPNFFKQLQIAYIDIMLAGVFLGALNFIFALREKFNLKGVVIFAIFFGIFIGLKSTASAYSILLLAPFLYLFLKQRQISVTVKTGYMLLFLTIAFILGSFCYLRNFILTGNPFYPLNVAILGKTMLKGVISKETFISRNDAGGYSLLKLLFHEGLGIQSLLIILPGTFLTFFVNVFKNRDKGLFTNYLMLLPMLLYLSYRFILPIPNSRYIYTLLGIGMITGFYFFNSIKMPEKIIRISAVLFIIISAFECARRSELIISLALSLLLFIVAALTLRYKRLTSLIFSKKSIASLIVVSLIILQLLFLNHRQNEYIRYVRNSRYWPDATRAWLWLNGNTQGNNIAYVGRPVPYPLYGTDYKNNVYYVSVNSIDPIHLHDLKDSNYSWDNAENMHKDFELPNNYRGRADYSIWLHNLKKKRTDFLFIYSLHHTKDIIFPIEEQWSRSNAKAFSPVFTNDTVRIYRINK